jgi:hypothetical protein
MWAAFSLNGTAGIRGQRGSALLRRAGSGRHRTGPCTTAVLGANPAYDAPADLDIAGTLPRVPFSVHHGLHLDETAALCTWHVPTPHPLEDWGDLRATDGTASIVQPLIRPLYGTRSAAILLGYDVVLRPKATA